MKKILIAVSNHATLGDKDQQNGTYSPEITHVIDLLDTAAIDYDIASIKGGKAPLYGTDIGDDEINSLVLGRDTFQNRINNSIPVSALQSADYAAVYYPGGFGLLSDLASHAGFAQVAADIYHAGGIISAVCHGPAGLLPITLNSGEKLLANKSVTGFSREEEIDYNTLADIPFLLEESLARTAARYSKKQPWTEHVVQDGRLITGQNPASAHAVGTALVKSLSAPPQASH